MIMNGIITISLSPVIDIHYSADSFVSALDYFGNVVTSLRRELQKAAAQGQQS